MPANRSGFWERCVRREIIVWSLLLLPHGLLVAQTHDIDSLRAVLAGDTRNDSTTAKTLYQLSRSYWVRDLDLAYASAEQLLDLSQRIGYATGVGNAYNSMGVVHWYQGNYAAAQHHHERALRTRLEVGEPAAIAASYHNLGLLQDDQGNYPEAMTHYLEAMKRYASIGDQEGVAQEHNALAVVHELLNDLPAALAENRKALAIREAAQDIWGLTETYSNLGVVHAAMDHYDSALVWYDKALALRERINDEQGLAISHNNYGDLHMMHGRYAEALASFRRALAINERLGYKKIMSNVYLNMGKLFERQGDLKQALEHLRTALRLAEEVGASDYAHQALRELSATAARMGQYAMAYEYRMRYEALNDSIFNADKTRSMVRQQMEYSFAQKQLTDSLATVEARHLAERDHQIQLLAEKRRRDVITLAGALVLVLSIGLWSRLRYVRRTRDTIVKAQRQLVISEKQREAEQVRTRIARDMHDELGSELTKIAMLIGEVKREQRVVPSSNGDTLERVAVLSGQVNRSLNDIVWAVDPQHDSVRSLLAHAQYFTDRMLEDRTILADQHFEHSGPDRSLDPAVKRNLFLLLKEAVNNALKYAQATHIRISLQTGPQGFKLLVKDNGVGFDPLQKGKDGNGLRNMQARCEALGAQLRITSAPGEGCTVEATGPLP